MKSLFDLLKNKRQDMTTEFDVKSVLGTGRFVAQETGQKLKLLFLTEPQDKFLSQV
jgi:hypothetical protein